MNFFLLIRFSLVKITFSITFHSTHQKNYEFFSLNSWSAFTEEAVYIFQVTRAARHRSFSLTALSNSFEISFSIRRLFFSFARSKRVEEDDISEYVSYENDEEENNENSMSNSTNYLNEAVSNEIWNIYSEFNSDVNDDIIYESENEKKKHATHHSNELEKTKHILKVMNRLRISFIKFFVTAMRSNTRIAKTFAIRLHEKENSNIFKELMIRKNKSKEDRLKILEIINWQTMLRRKIVKLFITAFFEKFNIKKYLEKFRYTDLRIVVENVLQSNAFFLLSLFRAIMTSASKQSHRDDSTRRLIIIFAIICFTYKSLTCINWSMQFALQFHAHDIKIRILKLKYQVDINSEYNAFLKVVKLMQREIAKEMIQKERSSDQWIMIWNNVEFTIEVREQRLDNIKRFISWTTAQQIMPTSWSSEEIHQHMYHSKYKLSFRNLLNHSHLNMSNDVQIQVNVFSCFHYD